MKKWFKAAFKAIENGQKRRAEYILLNTLSDRDLKDIGIHRSQIQGIVYGENSD
jgi:uncharacterized protein YjiS (DUF1127 family)